MRLLLPVLLLAVSVSAPAQAPPGPAHYGVWEGAEEGPVPEAAREALRQRLVASMDSLRRLGLLPEPPARATSVPLGWPLRAVPGYSDPGYHGVRYFVDLNPAVGAVLDHQCGGRTYDLASGYNHRGTDILTWPFAWRMMDNDEVEVVAAADGVIIYKSDGQPDRNCALTSGVFWNAVYVRHADGSVAWYGHLKQASLTTLPVGAAVSAGDYLGVVGSSGNSTGPHLHFELYADTAVTQLVDPWAGPCNPTTPMTWWEAQRPYFDGAVNAVRTHSAPPVFPTCPQTVEQPNEQAIFAPGTTAVMAAYFRDVRPGDMFHLTVRRPDGTPFNEWDFVANVVQYRTAVYWWWNIPIPSGGPTGTWTWEAAFNGTTAAREFTVGTVTANEGGPGEGLLSLTVAPNPARSDVRVALRLARPGTVRVDVLDPLGRVVARVHDGPLAGGAEHTLTLDSAALAAGAYLVRVAGEGFTATRRLTIAR